MPTSNYDNQVCRGCSRELYITEFKSVKTGFHNAGSIKSWPLRREIGEASVFSSRFSRESKPKPCIFVSMQLTTRTTRTAKAKS